jgi:hypothetical protein
VACSRGKKSGDGAHRRGRATGSGRRGGRRSGGRRRGWLGPAARGRPGGEEAAVNRGKEQLEGALTGGGRTAAMLGWSSARRRGSGGAKPTRWMPGRWRRACGARAWTGETKRRAGEKNSADGRRGALFKGADGGRNWGGGSGDVVDTWRKRHEQGGPYRPASGVRPTAARNRRARGTCAVRALSDEQRGRVRLTGGPRQQCRAGPIGQRKREREWRAGARGPAREGKGWAEPS